MPRALVPIDSTVRGSRLASRGAGHSPREAPSALGGAVLRHWQTLPPLGWRRVEETHDVLRHFVRVRRLLGLGRPGIAVRLAGLDTAVPCTSRDALQILAHHSGLGVACLAEREGGPRWWSRLPAVVK